jgi:hypothetical protein
MCGSVFSHTRRGGGEKEKIIFQTIEKLFNGRVKSHSEGETKSFFLHTFAGELKITGINSLH